MNPQNIAMPSRNYESCTTTTKGSLNPVRLLENTTSILKEYDSKQVKNKLHRKSMQIKTYYPPPPHTHTNYDKQLPYPFMNIDGSIKVKDIGLRHRPIYLYTRRERKKLIDNYGYEKNGLKKKMKPTRASSNKFVFGGWQGNTAK